MTYIVKISGSNLIEALEEKLGNVFENIKEDDRITNIKLYGDDVEITIGRVE